MEMMKSFFGYLIVAVSIVLFGWFIKTRMDNKTYSNRTISARGVSERQVEATTGVGQLFASVYNDDLNQLKSISEEQIAQIKSFVKKYGFEDSEIEIICSITDRHKDYVGDIKYRPVERYSSNFQVKILTNKTKELYNLQKNLGKLLDESGILLDSNYFNYDYNDLSSVKPEMITEATVSARESADRFAQDSNSKIGKIKYANQGYFSIDPIEGVEPYILKVRVVVSVEFYLD